MEMTGENVRDQWVRAFSEQSNRGSRMRRKALQRLLRRQSRIQHHLPQTELTLLMQGPKSALNGTRWECLTLHNEAGLASYMEQKDDQLVKEGVLNS